MLVKMGRGNFSNFADDPGSLAAPHPIFGTWLGAVLFGVAGYMVAKFRLLGRV